MSCSRRLGWVGLIVGLGIASLAGAASAGDPPAQYRPQDVVKAYGGTAADPCDGAGAETADCAPQATMRGFSLAQPGKSPTRAKTGLTAHARPGDLLLTFEVGSAQLSPQGRANARAFATALASPALASTRFVIEGHTDATGLPARNLQLSQDRADAVKSFLVSRGVAAERLDAKGFGSTRLADPAHPRAGTNRRVEAARLN